MAVVKKVAEGESQTDAYQEVYGVGKDTARVNASRMLSKESVQGALKTALREKGLTEEWIAKTIKKLADSRDWRAQSEAIDKVVKLCGWDKTPEEEKKKVTDFQINFVSYTDEELNSAIESRQDKLTIIADRQNSSEPQQSEPVSNA